jgi:hypothetical protein
MKGKTTHLSARSSMGEVTAGGAATNAIRPEAIEALPVASAALISSAL